MPTNRSRRIQLLGAVGLVVTVGLAASSGASSAPASGEASSARPPVQRIARELARAGAKSVIVYVSAGDKKYVATAGTRRPATDQRFRVGSVTKSFTATIVLQLVQEGRLRLSSTLDDHLPGVIPRGDAITIRQLLAHRSGLANFTDYRSWYEEASRSPSTRPIDILRFAGSKPLDFDPGSQWRYSNTNYIALGLVIERVTGRSYVEELEQRILRPLELDHTELAETRRLPDLDDDGENPNLPWAAGAIVSNARDLSRFYSALLSGRVLSSATLAAMKETIAVDGPVPVGAGLGIFSSEHPCGRSWGHGGGILDYSTLVSANEEGDRVAVMSVHGRMPLGRPPDESALVCAQSRLAESARNSKLAFVRGSRSGPGLLYVVNADGSGQRVLARKAASGVPPAWSPDGRKIAFVRRRGGNSEVYVMTADGSGQRYLTRNATAPVWSPDGRKIAFVRERGGNSEICVMNADGSGRRRLTRDAAAPTWSPDGREIAFIRERGGNSEVYVMNADGSAQRNLTRNAASDLAPAWSPDGRRIAFVSRPRSDFEVYVMNADGSGQRRLTRNREPDFAPAWSPDGRKIAFERRRGWGGPAGSFVDFDVYVVNADGSSELELAQSGRQPLWSPDGRTIAFLSSRSGNSEVYVMNADGLSEQRNVTRSPGDESLFAWAPGRRK